MATTITKVERVGDTDVVVVTGTVDGVPVVAQGWLSAMTNHFPPAAYDADGSIKAGQTPRKMTAAEKLAYAKALLTQAAASATADLGISG